MKTLVFFTIVVALNNCTEDIVRPNLLYEDEVLYRKIEKSKAALVKEEVPKIQDINALLNDYETYKNKAHQTIQNNNRLAKDQKQE